jgi:phage terminase Nu1 subunit (DNA packaging protein)
MPMIELNDANAICSGNQLAQIIGCSPRQIDVLRVEGALVCARSKLRGRRYRLAESVQRYIAHEKQRAKAQSASNNNVDGYSRARERKMNAAALIEELRARQLTGELIEREQALLVFGLLVSNTKSRLLAVPNKAMHELAHRSAPEANVIVKRHVTTALRELAAFDPKSLGKTARAVHKKNGNNDDDDHL